MASILGPISQGVGDVLGGIGNVVSTIETNKANAEENQKTRDWNLKMWQMQNEYNTPAAQMARDKAAGLNTNLMYSQGSTGNAGAVQSTPPVQFRAPSVDFPNIMAIVAQAAQIENLEAQKRQVDNNTDKTAWEAGSAFEKYIQDHLINRTLFSGNQGADIHAPVVHNTPTWPSGSDVISNSEPYNLWETKFRAALQGQLNQNENTALGNVLRQQETEIGGQLKPYNMTSSDPAWLRGLLLIGNKLGILQKIFGTNTNR